MTHIYNRPSPNHDARPADTAITCIVLHSTAGEYPGDLQWLTSTKSQVSAHYLIAPDGLIFRLVPEERRAWHAGLSRLNGRDDVNDFSIGIELSYPAKGRPVSAAQLAACRELCIDIIRRRPIVREQIVTHRRISPGRKTDPHGWPDGAIAVWIDSLYAPAPDPWAAWGTAHALPVEQRTFGIPRAWLPDRAWLKAAISAPIYTGAHIVQLFQGGAVHYDTRSDTPTLVKFPREY